MSSRAISAASGNYDGAVSSRFDDATSGRPGFSPARQPSQMSSGRAGISGFDHTQGAPVENSILTETAANQDDGIDTIPNQSATSPEFVRSESRMSQTQSVARSGTLKKKTSMKRTGSLGRSASRRSSYAGSIRSAKVGEGVAGEAPVEQAVEKPAATGVDNNSAFYCPVPTSGNPTELLANRFQAWRKVLKDLITYFSQLSKHYDQKAKAMATAGQVLSVADIPAGFTRHGGIGESITIMRDYHRQAQTESAKASSVQNDIVVQLTGLRSDLQQKIKEIKSLSGDFKNSVDKEMDNTKRAVRSYQDSIGNVDRDVAQATGKGDPFIVKLGVDRQVEKQLEEETYLHRAYLNLENSGRELESIVVGEIQKAYNAYSGMLRREADEEYEASERLKEGPLALAKDFEWEQFTTNNTSMIDPKLTVRNVKMITYPGQDHPAAIEVRAGMLERKSKYLKNYTPGWYILSPTHLHEFKSADRIAFQVPIMSLYLPEQKLGSHADPGSSSHKFMLKGRQSGGSMHRGHSWVFRAESHETMMAWFEMIKELTEKTGEARNDFVRRTHARSVSGNSLKPSTTAPESLDGMEEDEADRVPYSSEQSVRGQSVAPEAAGAGLLAGGGIAAAGMHDIDDNRSEAGWRPPQRPSPGGRFPSDIDVARGLQAPHSPSSDEMVPAMDGDDHADMMAAAALPGSGVPFSDSLERHSELQPQEMATEQSPSALYQPAPVTPTRQSAPQPAGYQLGDFRHGTSPVSQMVPTDGTSNYGEWMAPMAAAGAGGAAIGAGAVGIKHHHDKQEADRAASERDLTPRPASSTRFQGIPSNEQTAIPSRGSSSAPIALAATGVTSAPKDVPVAATVPTTEPMSAGEEESHERSLSRPRAVTQSTHATTGTGMTADTLASSGIDARHGGASSVGGASLSTVPTSVDGNGMRDAEEPTSSGIANNDRDLIYAKDDVTNSTSTTLPPPVTSGIPHRATEGLAASSGPGVAVASTAAGGTTTLTKPLSSESHAQSYQSELDPYPTTSTNPTINNLAVGGNSALRGSSVPALKPSATSSSGGIVEDTSAANGGVTGRAMSAERSKQMGTGAFRVDTISDLHVPGEFPKLSAEQARVSQANGGV